MKKLILLLCLATASSGATFIRGTCAGAGGPNTGVTATLDTTGANFIFVSAAYFTAGTFVDSGSNTWTSLGTTGTNPTSQNFYVASPSGTGVGQTFTYSGTATYTSVCVAAFSGVLASSPFDSPGASNTATSISLATGSVTPTLATDFMITAVASGGGGSPFSVDSSFIITNTIAFVASTHYAVGIAYKLSTSTAQNVTWTNNVSQVIDVGLAAFKSASGGVRHRVVSQ